MAEINKSYSNSTIDQSKYYSTTDGSQNLLVDENGILGTLQMIEGYKELAKELAKTFNLADEITKRVSNTAKEIRDVANEYEHISKMNAAQRKARDTSYQEAINEQKSKGNNVAAARLQRDWDNKKREEDRKFYQEMIELMKTMNPEERKDARKEMVDYFGSEEKLKQFEGQQATEKALKTLSIKLGAFAKELDSTIKSVANYKTAWDTRLYGTSSHTMNPFENLSKMVNYGIGVSPFIKQSSVMEKLNTAISEGISYNVEQRAFLDVLKEGIATTFEAFDTTLKNLVRVQQADSTSYRLGMEASLTEYLNRMFDNTEYMSDLAKATASNLYESTSLLEASQAIGYEYQVQKWLGSLYSVGMSNNSVTAIADAVGKLLSGDISGTDSGAGKLLVMAAANSGIDYAKMLTDGINESDVNLLLGSMVSYLQQIASDNKVVQSQMANIFGLKTSDIEAAKNLTGFVNDIYKQDKDYSASTATSKLFTMMGTYITRANVGSMLDTLMDNFKYVTASSIAENPTLYSIYSIGNLLDETMGGIQLPAISVIGNMVDLETSVADLLRVAAMSGTILQGTAALMTGLAGSVTPLTTYGMISSRSRDTVQIGKGLGLKANENDISQLSLNYKSNSNQDDFTSANNAMAEDTKEEARINSKEGNEDQIDLQDINNSQLEVIQILNDLVDGSKSIHIVSDYRTGSNPWSTNGSE